MKTHLLTLIVTRIKHIFFVFIMLIALIGCEKQKNKEADIIRTLLINNEYTSYFKVPSSYTKVIDTNKLLINNRFIVQINPKLDSIPKKIDKTVLRHPYKDIFKKCTIIEEDEKLILKNLEVKSAILLQETKKVDLNTFEKYHVYMSFSRIFFSKEKDKALLFISTQYDYLDGSYDICFLQKENGVWNIFGCQNISTL